MKFLFWIIVVFVCFFLQGKISILEVSPNLTILLVYYIGIKYGEMKGMASGIVIGFLEDSISYSIIGPNLLAKGSIGFLSSFFISGGILRWTPLLGILTISSFTILDNSVVFLSRSIFDRMPADLSWAVFISIMQSLLNAPAGIFIKPTHAD